MRPSRLTSVALGVLAATTACSQEPPTAPTSSQTALQAPEASQLETQQARQRERRRDTGRRRRDTDRRRRYGYIYYIPYTYPYYETYNPPYQGYGVNTVVISGYQYNPGNINVPVGGTVTWINQDSVAHSVTSPLPGQVTTTGAFDGVLQPGQSYSYTFNLPGRVDYYCRFHSGMQGSVTVGG